MPLTASDEIRIETALPADLEVLPGIEARASEIFPARLVPPDLPLQTDAADDLREAIAEGRVFVARRADDRVVGFAFVESMGSDGLLDELDVEPDHGRRGIGRRLVERACDWARGSGYARIVLSTFRDIPWNGPFYARIGFEELAPNQWTEEMIAMRRHESERGLDIRDRILMKRALDET